MRPIRTSATLCLVAASLAAQVTFTEEVATTGTSFDSFGRGAAMVDFDLDGRLDLFAGAALDPSRIWRQLPDGTFADRTLPWGMPQDEAKTWAVVAADFDNDADCDIFLGNGGFYGPAEPNQLLRNDIPTQTTFVDVTDASGLGDEVGQTFGSTTLDHDKDGDLDIFWSNVGGNGMKLFRNDGDMVFADVSAASGVQIPGRYRHAGSGDYDNDGWPDIGVGGGSNSTAKLFHNDGDGTFTDVAAAAGVGSPPDKDEFGIVFTDFDNDGWLDLFVPIYQADFVTTVSRLYMNDQDGTFTDVSEDTIITGQTDMGHNVGDLDADGYPDIYIGTGHPLFADLDLLYLVTPDGGGGLVLDDVSASSGITVGGTETRCHGMAFGDVDGDGDVDVYANNGGPSINELTAQENFFLRNDGNGNNWLKLSVEGVISPRMPVGLKAWATTPTREVHRLLTAGKGFGNTDDPTLHFGLGGEVSVARLDVLWPSGIEQTVFAPELSSTTELVETGMVLQGEPALGGSITLRFASDGNQDATLWTGTAGLEVPLPKYGGTLYLNQPMIFLLTLPTGPSGKLDLPLSIPDAPELSGVTVPLQSWIRPAGAKKGGTLSQLVEIAIP